ncbi:Armadillo-type fold [Phytophthora cactorum]|nr:Armadillo-type fold [Phytophthora cactorum]
MATKLGERLEELAAFLAHPHAVDSVEETLGHLQTEVADAMARSRASAQQCTILLFQSAEPPSLLRFLSTSADFADDARKREISSARGGVLELLAAFVKAYGTHRALTKQHVVDLYKACQQTARADPFNRVKAHALTVVVNVLKYADKRVTSDDIEPRAYAEKLFYDIKFSKATQTAKGQMLEVIGYLVEKFPKHVEENVPALLSWIENELEKQFSSNSPEMMMVNGLLFALARLLECDVERYKRDEALRKKIYSYLLTVFATTISGNLSRYQVTNSSETFLAKHAQLFKQEIGPNGFVWFSYMKFCCQSENKKIIYHPDTGELVTNLLYEYEGFWLALLRRRTETVVEPTVTTGSDDVEMKEPSDAGRSLQAILFDSTVKHVLAIINQLNLSYQFDLQTTNNGKNATGYLVSHTILVKCCR